MSETKIMRCDCGCAKEAEAGTFNAPGWVKVYGGKPNRFLDFASWECLSRWSLDELRLLTTEVVVR